jgi:hypothetical protein
VQSYLVNFCRPLANPLVRAVCVALFIMRLERAVMLTALKMSCSLSVTGSATVLTRMRRSPRLVVKSNADWTQMVELCNDCRGGVVVVVCRGVVVS